MISTDRLIFDEKSSVRLRQIEYAKKWGRVDIVVFTLKKDSFPKELSISENCTVHGTDSVSKFAYPFKAISLGSEIIKDNSITDITCQDPFLTAMAGVSLKKKFKIPLEIQIHGDIGSPYFARTIGNKVRISLAKKYLPEADKIRVVSGRVKDYVDELLAGNQSTKPIIEVKPIAVDKTAIKNAPVLVDLRRKYRQFDRIVLMASRLEGEKNIDLAIEAWSLVNRSFPNAGLVIVSSGGAENDLKRLVVSNGLAKSVIFEKWANRETLYSYYKTADLFLNSSLYEGYGMTLVEAEAAGAKIVSTDVGVAREIGAIIAEHDKKDLAQKVMGAISRNKPEVGQETLV